MGLIPHRNGTKVTNNWLQGKSQKVERGWISSKWRSWNQGKRRLGKKIGLIY